MNNQAVIELPVDFVIVTTHPTRKDDGAPDDRKILEIGDMKIVYWAGCTTYYEIEHPSKDGRYVQIFVPNEQVEYDMFQINPSGQMPDMTDIRIQEALA